MDKLKYWWWFVMEHQAYFTIQPKEWKLAAYHVYYDGNHYVLWVGPLTLELCDNEN